MATRSRFACRRLADGAQTYAELARLDLLRNKSRVVFCDNQVVLLMAAVASLTQERPQQRSIARRRNDS
ncbi:hypothetical protein COLSTE_02337 [Collinsella stercoris DSM 13279]|uniref:Uncharacterized protein n=1 Tax=Collinsella stercoris DSM 13279 TaxID=445975 RepID=B6GE01_9ACTN|nr:hypothetical protein COLSTE_02337 [Collinsella stercoris DSM 13279]